MKITLTSKIAIIILMAAINLTACKVTKDVASPDLNMPKVYRGTPPDTSSIAAMPWQSFFKDAALKALIGQALQHNNDLQVAVKNVDAAELVFKQAKMGNLPSIGLAVSASDARPSDNSLNGLTLNEALKTTHITDYSLAASLSWEADIWGKIRSQNADALAAYLSTAEAQKALQTRIINDISKGYYNLLMLDTQFGIAKRNTALADSTLELVRLQYRSGNALSLAVQESLAQKLTAAALVPEIEQQIALQETAISVLTGGFSAAVKRAGGLDDLIIPEKLSAGLPSELLSRRPDVRQAELKLSQANAQVGYTKAAMYPSLTINAQGGLDAIKASNWFNIPASLFGIVAGGIAEPVFARKRLATQYRVAKVNREKSVLGFRQSVLTAYGEVSDALVQIDKLSGRQEIITERTDALSQATKNAQALYKSGMATYLEVIIAERNLLQSELELATVKKSRLDATVDLYRSLGGGWK